MKILIKNCNLISMDESRPKIEYNIDILINEKNIEKIEKNIPLNDEFKIIAYLCTRPECKTCLTL